jgi:hypothetical protein
MSLIKKADVKRHFAVRRAIRQAAARLVSRPYVARIEPSGTTADAPDFIEDVTLKHSSSSVPVTSIPMAADSAGSRVSRLHESPQA